MAKALGCPSLAPNKPARVAHIYKLSAQKIEAGSSEVQGHLWLHREFQASLGFRRAYLKVWRERQILRKK